MWDYLELLDLIIKEFVRIMRNTWGIHAEYCMKMLILMNLDASCMVRNTFQNLMHNWCFKVFYNFHELRAYRIKHLDPPWTNLLMVRCMSNITVCCLYYYLLSHGLYNGVYNKAIPLRVGLNGPSGSLATVILWFDNCWQKEKIMACDEDFVYYSVQNFNKTIMWNGECSAKS